MFRYEEFYRQHVSNLRITASGQSYGRCPLHSDDHESFSCHLETGFWYCHAGCGSGNTITFSRRIGTSEPTPLMESQPSDGLISSSRKECAAPFSKPKEQKKIVATYQYKYEDGSDAYQVVRFEPKGFSQRRMENGKWVWGTTGIRKVPYNLPEVIKSSHIILVEGEKDADKLISLDLVATTTPMGAGNWDTSYACWFKGKSVAIIPDNDLPGKEYAQNAARDITDNGGIVRLIELPGVQEKGDISDYLELGGNSKSTFLDLVRNAPICKYPSKNNELPLEYFSRYDTLVPDGRGALPNEYEVFCKEAFKQIMLTAKNCNDRVLALIGELEKIWKGCGTERKYNAFLWKLKEIHMESML